MGPTRAGIRLPNVQNAILKELENGPATTYDLITTIKYNPWAIREAVRLLRDRNLVMIKKQIKMIEIPKEENLISLI